MIELKNVERLTVKRGIQILKIQNGISKFILGVLAIFTTLVLIKMSMFYAENYATVNRAFNWGSLLLALILVGAVGYFLVKVNDRNKKINISILLGMLLIFMIVATTWILVVPQTQLSDFGNFWTRVSGVFNGDKLYKTDNDYFSRFAYQSGYMAYVLGVVKIFGYHIFAIQFLNVIYQALILLFTYLLVVKIFENIKMARLAVLLLMIDLDWFALNSQASNQYLGSLCYLLTFYLIMQDKLWAYILSGVTLTIGCLIRPIGPVIVAGIVVFALLYTMFENGKFNYRKPLKILLSLMVYLVLFSLAGWGIKASGLNAYGLSNYDPEWKFVTGLNYQSNGTYSPDMDRLIDASKPRKVMSKKEKAALRQEITYLNKNNKWLSLFINKVGGLWSQRTMATNFTGYSQNHSAKTVERVDYLGYVGSIILIILSWIGSFVLFKTKFSNNLYLLLLPMLAFAAAQLLIEVQGRYRIEFLPIIAILASLGLYRLIKEKDF